MEQMRVYIANLGKYNEGELVGAWFNPPVDFDEVKERIGLNDEYEEYAIHDYELPFEIDEYTPIEEINRLCGLAEELEGTPIGEVALEIQHAFFNSFEAFLKYLGIPVAVTWFMSQKTFDGKKPLGFLRSFISYHLRFKVTFAGKKVKEQKKRWDEPITLVRSVNYVPD